MSDYKDGSRLQFIKSGFVRDGQICVHHLWRLVFLFYDNKINISQAAGHNNELIKYFGKDVVL